jgi:hypothetical protein
MARKLFFSCAVVLCLALAFHLIGTRASAQVGGPGWFLAGTDLGGSPYAVTDSGQWWRYVPSYGWLSDVGNLFGSAAGSRVIVSVAPGMALTSNGEVWYGGVGGVWQNAGVPPLGPTAAKQETWGSVKARYRPSAPATRQ